MKRFAERLREIRGTRGMSLAQVARRAGIQTGYLCGIETSKKRPPSPRVVRALARALRHDRMELLLLAYVEKAPDEIRKLLEAALAAAKAA
jgi:transcriptional regulator with XRE-family HTH domain